MSKSNKTDIALSGYTFEGARETAVRDIARAVFEEQQDKKQVELRFIGGLIARRLFPDLPRKDALAKGIGIAGGTSPGRNPKPGQHVRTTVLEQPAWESARKQWTRCAQDAGVVERKPRAQKPAQGKAKGKPAKAKPAVKLAAKPKDARAANVTLLNMAQMASGFCAKHKAVVSPEASKLVADFLSGMAHLAK